MTSDGAGSSDGRLSLKGSGSTHATVARPSLPSRLKGQRLAGRSRSPGSPRGASAVAKPAQAPAKKEEDLPTGRPDPCWENVPAPPAAGTGASPPAPPSSPDQEGAWAKAGHGAMDLDDNWYTARGPATKQSELVEEGELTPKESWGLTARGQERLMKKYDDLLATHHDLLRKNANLQAECDRVKRELDHAWADITDLKGRCDDYAVKEVVLEDEIDILKRKVADKADDAAHYRRQRNRADDLVEALQQDITETRDLAAAQSEQLAEYGGALAAVRSELEQALGQLSEVTLERAKAEQTITALSGALQRSQQLEAENARLWHELHARQQQPAAHVQPAEPLMPPPPPPFAGFYPAPASPAITVNFVDAADMEEL